MSAVTSSGSCGPGKETHSIHGCPRGAAASSDAACAAVQLSWYSRRGLLALLMHSDGSTSGQPRHAPCTAKALAAVPFLSGTAVLAR